MSRSRRLRSSYRSARRWRCGSFLCRGRSRRRRRGERWALAEHRLDHSLGRSFRSSDGGCGGNRLLSNRSGWCSGFRRGCGRCSDRLRSGWRCGCFSLLLEQQAGDISRFGDVREIDLGLDLRFARARAAVASRACCTLSGEVLAHTLGLVRLDRARVRLLFRYSDKGKDVENRFALDFQFPC